MKDTDIDQIARNPKFAPAKRNKTKQSRSVNDLFKDVEQEVTFKDKRGRPWLKNPRAYARAELRAREQREEKFDEDKESQLEESSSSDSEVSPTHSISSSEEDSSSESNQNVDQFEHIEQLCDADWHELVKDAVPATSTGRRLALLHFDWDHAKAENVYMVLESFLPPKGHIERVTIYPSEFGIKRLEEESISGPPELVNPSTSEEPMETDQSNRAEDDDTVDGDDERNPVEVDDKAGWRTAPTTLKRRVRKYQLARLKYFYAIIEFDCTETADFVYRACDGYEYESSGARLDLRFVSDDEVFSVRPEHAYLVSECREINKAKYNPRPFETGALHSTRISISWDKTADERTGWLQDQFKPDMDPKSTLLDDRDQLEKYLALSSSGASTAASSDVDEPPPAPTVPRIRRHRPKKLRPDELRTALLGAVVTGGGDNDGDRMEQFDLASSEEEVFDLAETADDQAIPSNNIDMENEAYDLRPVEKRVSKSSIKHLNSKKKSKVSRRALPEAKDNEEEVEAGSDDSSIDFDWDQLDKEMDETTTVDKSISGNHKRKYRERQRKKMLKKKQNAKERMELQASLWTATNDQMEDARFDAFLIDPSYRISQTHPDYKEASDFLRYMRNRKSKSGQMQSIAVVSTTTV